MLFLPTYGWSDTIITSDGREYHGTIISETEDEVIIKIGTREISVPTSMVVKIVYSEDSTIAVEKEVQPSVDPDMLEAFYAQSLSITSGRRGFGYGTGSVSTYGGASLAAISGSWAVWKGFHGSMKVKEAEFFHIAGRDDLAEKAERYHSRTKRRLIISGTAYLGGIVLALAGMDSAPLFGTGIVLGIVGGYSFIFLGIIPSMKSAVDINSAAGAARVYNERLLLEVGITVPLNEIKPQF